MRLLVFVSKTIGFECLKWLLSAYPDDDYTIFISDPDKNLIADYLDGMGRPYHDLTVTDPAAQTEGQSYDWIINIWGAYIFRPGLLDRAAYSLNLHPSLLPYGRGRDPVVWALRDGVPAGATLHVITEGVDEGPIWAQTEIPYDFPTTGGELYQKVERASIKLFCDTWPGLRANKLTPRLQGRPDLPTRRRKDLLADRVFSLEDPAAAVLNRLLAHDFSENGYTALLKAGEKTYSVTLKLDTWDK